MIIQSQPMEGLWIVRPAIFEDARGTFIETYHQEKLTALIGKRIDFPQSSEVHSRFGTLRGLHFQRPPHAQEKIIRVIAGTVLDVVVDIRKHSPTYGQYASVLLSGENKLQFYISEGFAHGYSVLSDMAIVHYKSSHVYVPASEQGIYPEDAVIGIDWQLPNEKRILSDKDKNAISWEKFISLF